MTTLSPVSCPPDMVAKFHNSNSSTAGLQHQDHTIITGRLSPKSPSSVSNFHARLDITSPGESGTSRTNVASAAVLNRKPNDVVSFFSLLVPPRNARNRSERRTETQPSRGIHNYYFRAAGRFLLSISCSLVMMSSPISSSPGETRSKFR